MLVPAQGLLGPSQNKGMTVKGKRGTGGWVLSVFRFHRDKNSSMRESEFCLLPWGSEDQAERPEWCKEQGSGMTWEGH